MEVPATPPNQAAEPAAHPALEPKRLHPLTMVQRVLVSLPALVFIMLPVLRGNGDSTAWFNLVFGAMYLVFIVPWIALHYLRFRYWITPGELVIHSGVLTRRRRNIPVERIQNIEIEQAPLQRMLGTAKVVVYTAGSAQAEGVLEYVSLAEAREIRTVVRDLQQQMQDVDPVETPVAESEAAPVERAAAEAEGTLLIALDPQRVFLAGAFRFSLIYLAVIFSTLQYIEPDPSLLFSWLIRGPLGAIFLGWLTGILVTFNRYYRFKLERIGDKLHSSHGLLTLKEGTIPLSRVQSWILRTNPLMEFFGWYRLEVQTMGINLNQSGYQVALPFGRREEVAAILAAVDSPALPEAWSPVSRLTIRRFMARSLVLLLMGAGIVQFWWRPVLWVGLVVPLLFGWALLRYRAMNVADDASWIAIRKGVIRRLTWMVPIDKMQTVGWYANWFQRRLGLASIYVDTAGASPGRSAELPDMEEGQARDLVTRVYSRFATHP